MINDIALFAIAGGLYYIGYSIRYSRVLQQVEFDPYDHEVDDLRDRLIEEQRQRRELEAKYLPQAPMPNDQGGITYYAAE